MSYTSHTVCPSPGWYCNDGTNVWGWDMNYFEDSFIRNGCDAQDPNDPNKHVVWSDAMVAWVCIDEYDNLDSCSRDELVMVE